VKGEKQGKLHMNELLNYKIYSKEKKGKDGKKQIAMKDTRVNSITNVIS